MASGESAANWCGPIGTAARKARAVRLRDGAMHRKRLHGVPRRPMLTRLKSHDTVIRGGSILDGTGAAAFADDVRSIAV